MCCNTLSWTPFQHNAEYPPDPPGHGPKIESLELIVSNKEEKQQLKGVKEGKVKGKNEKMPLSKLPTDDLRKMDKSIYTE